MATGITIASLEWGNRDLTTFIDGVVKNAKVLDLFTLIDGVKSKTQVPIYDAQLTWGNDLCVFDPQSSATIDEKEMTVQNWKWSYQNCKEVLQQTYRSKLLKQGANTDETMDAGFGDWLFDYFAKQSSAKVVELAASEIKTEIAGDTSVIKPTQVAGSIDETNVLARMQAAYKEIPSELLNALFGGADREFAPAYFMSATTMQYYQLAIANAYTTVYDGTAKGSIMPYLGMDVILFSTLANDEFLVTNPANLVMVVDEYTDVNAIQSEYDAKVSSDFIWGQFTIGFSYFVSENIVYSTHGA